MARRIVNNSLLDVKPQLNLLANGGFESWSGSISMVALGGYFTPAGPDSWGWGQGQSGDTVLTASKETSLQYKGSACLKMVITGTTAQGTSVGQFIGGSNSADVGVVSFAKSVRGKTLSLSLAVKTTIAGKIKIRLRDDIGSSDSAYHTGSGNWEILTVTRAIDLSAAYVAVFLGGMVSGDFSAGTYYMDAGMLVMGDRPVTFVPENPELDKVKVGAITNFESNQPNLLAEGGFEYWPYGTVFNNWEAGTNGVQGQPVTPHWKPLFTTSSFAITKETTEVKSGKASVKMVTTGSGYSCLAQYFDAVAAADFAGKVMTFSCWLKTSNAGMVIQVYDGSYRTSTPHTGSGNWEKLSVTFTHSGLAYLYVYVGSRSGPAGVGTYYFDDASLVYGTVAGSYNQIQSNYQLTKRANVQAVNEVNQAINGSFGVWQRGSSFSGVVNNQWTCDGWRKYQNGGGASTFVVSEVSGYTNGAPSGGSILQATISGIFGGANTHGIYQSLARASTLHRIRNKMVAASCWVKASSANVVRLRLEETGAGAFTFRSNGNVGTGWERLTVYSYISVNANPSDLYVGLDFQQDGTFYAYGCSVSIIEDDTAIIIPDYIQEDFAVQLMRCQRIYQVLGKDSASNYMILMMKCKTGEGNGPVVLPVLMQATPTITFSSQTAFNVENAAGTQSATTAMSYSTLNPRGGRVQAVNAGLVAGDATILYGQSVNAYIEYEV